MRELQRDELRIRKKRLLARLLFRLGLPVTSKLLGLGDLDGCHFGDDRGLS